VRRFFGEPAGAGGNGSSVAMAISQFLAISTPWLFRDAEIVWLLEMRLAAVRDVGVKPRVDLGLERSPDVRLSEIAWVDESGGMILWQASRRDHRPEQRVTLRVTVCMTC